MLTQETQANTSAQQGGLSGTLRTPVGFFALVVLIVEFLLGLGALFSQGERGLLVRGMLFLIFSLVAVVAGLGIFRPGALGGSFSLRGRALGRGAKKRQLIQELPSRPRYLDATLEHADGAKRSVWLSVNTLDPSRTDARIKDLQEKLSGARAAGVDVKILAPGGVDRIEAIHELSIVRKIPIRVLAALDDEQFRFTVIDDELVIISMPLGAPDSSSDLGAVIRSQRLNALLRHYYDELWGRSIAM